MMQSSKEEEIVISNNKSNDNNNKTSFANAIIKKYSSDYCTAVFYNQETGPDVLWENCMQLLHLNYVIENTITLKQMAVNYMVAIGMGHNYSNGVFELPIPDTNRYRALASCFYIDKIDGDPTTLNQSYIQFILILPTELMEYFRSSSYYQDEFIELLVNNLPNKFTKSSMEKLNPMIMNFLTKQIVKP